MTSRTITHHEGTVERGKCFRGTPQTFGKWHEQGSDNAVQFDFEQDGRTAVVTFDLAPSPFDGIGEGPVTLSVKMEYDRATSEPFVTGARLHLSRIQFEMDADARTSFPLDQESSFFSRFASAALQISAMMFSEHQFVAAVEAERDAEDAEDAVVFGSRTMRALA